MKPVICTLLFILPTLGNSQIYFENQATQQNINSIIDLGFFGGGGGVSFYDFNNDGWDDLTVGTSAGDSIDFYQNINGNFVKLPSLVDDTSEVKQVNWVDIDNDGDKDLFIVRPSQGCKLYENLGGMNMSDITATCNIDSQPMSGIGASWGDIDNDGYLDVYISTRTIGSSISNMLYKNNGNNTFTDVTISSGVRDTNSLSFCAAWFDYNNDGWQDIYSTADRLFSPNRLFENNGDGTFTDVSIVSNSFIFNYLGQIVFFNNIYQNDI